MRWFDKLLAGALVATVVTMLAATSAHAYFLDLLWWLHHY